MTNDGAKYETVPMRLDLAKVVEASLVVIHSDSQVIIRHINGDYEAKGEWMKKYLSLVKRGTDQNFAAEFVQVTWEENEHVDRLVKAASAEQMTIGCQVLSFTQHSPAIEELKIKVISASIDWMILITSYLKNGTLQEDYNVS